ncbi:hypothetical protein WUBG_07426, partial [Wuchereria bancrofti]
MNGSECCSEIILHKLINVPAALLTSDSCIALQQLMTTTTTTTKLILMMILAMMKEDMVSPTK